jgi:hypothetical protein
MHSFAKSTVRFALLTLAIGLAMPVFAQSPKSASGNNTAPSVAGTTWTGPDTHGRHYVYEFLTDGTLHYTYENGSFTNATWKQDGDSIYISINNGYSERKGRITGAHMEGDAWNVKGEKWTWVADKK